MGLIAHLKKMDWVMTGAAFFLVVIGLISIYSSSAGRGNFLNFEKQLIFLGIGAFLMFLVSSLDYRIVRENPYFILSLYLLSLIFLVGLFFLAPEIRGTKSWYKIGPISIDPIEFTKIVLIMILAKYFSMRHVEMYSFRHILFSGIYVFVPAALIFLQPNLGSALILVAIWGAILFVSGIQLRHFLILMLISFLFLAFSWNFLLEDYQKERVNSFLFPQSQPLEVGWSQNQAKIAIGSGGILGTGFMKGSQARDGFLPEPHTDFIFAAIGEEFGLAGITILMSVFILFLWRIFKLSIGCQSNFPRLFSIGFLALLCSQAFINIGMNLGMLPVIGVSMPLVSYGGSSLVFVLLSVGILQSIKIHSSSY